MNILKRLLKNKTSRKRSGYSKIISNIGGNTTEREKGKNEENFCNYKLLNTLDKRKIMFLLNKVEKKKKITNNSINNIYKYKNIKNKNSKKNYNLNEIEKFFLFICDLSEYQIKILNESQPKASTLRNNLPVVITNQFKDCLTNSQRLNLSLIETMSLSRYLLLKNPNDDIYLDNLDFSFILYDIKQNKNIRTDRDKNINIKNNENLNSISLQRNKIKNKNEKTKFNNILDEIIDDKNQEFIKIYRERILNVLIYLNNDEKQLVINSKSYLKKLIENIKKSLIDK